MIRVGINGFGRIGRTLFKILSERDDIHVVKVNDIHPLETMVHLLKYDSVHGVLKTSIKVQSESSFEVNELETIYSQEKEIGNIKWNDLDVVFECSGKYKTRELLDGHIKNGCKSVILSVPPLDSSIKMIVMGVNEGILKSTDVIISNASCTTNSAAHLVNIMSSNFEIDSCFITTVHSYTSDQNLHDSPHSDLRRARGAIQSIIPTTTGAAKALTRIFPKLSNKLGGCGIRVPVPNGSLTDLTFTLNNPPSVSAINELVRSYSENSLKKYLYYSEEPLVSSDIIGNPFSCVFDSELTSVVGNMVKLVGWYDNEIGYSNRLVDALDYHQSL